MRFESIQYSKMRLRSDPAGKAYSVSQNPWGRYKVSRPTQNFGWVGHIAFGPTSNWPVYVYSLILFVNLLKLVPPDVRF